MLAWLDKTDWFTLALVGGLLMFAPYSREPHLVEKLRMLVQGSLQAPVDVFDLLMHASPLVLFGAKLTRQRQLANSKSNNEND